MSSDKVAYLQPAGAITPTGTWSVAARAGDFLYIAGMRGIDPSTNKLVEGDENRIRRAFQNMKHIADSEGDVRAEQIRSHRRQRREDVHFGFPVERPGGNDRFHDHYGKADGDSG